MRNTVDNQMVADAMMAYEKGSTENKVTWEPSTLPEVGTFFVVVFN